MRMIKCDFCGQSFDISKGRLGKQHYEHVEIIEIGYKNESIIRDCCESCKEKIFDLVNMSLLKPNIVKNENTDCELKDCEFNIDGRCDVKEIGAMDNCLGRERLKYKPSSTVKNMKDGDRGE